jgi:predicted cupin superfamily sugar epimerase
MHCSPIDCRRCGGAIGQPVSGALGWSPTVSTRAESEHLARLLRLEPLSLEGGLFRRTYADEHSSAIFLMLLAPDFSAMHRLEGVEIYYWYAGSPLQLLLLYSDGRIERPVLGPHLAAGATPQIVVPAGVWQGASPLGEWTLAGTTMAPPFEWSAFRLGRRADLLAGWPHAASQIRALTRD